MKKFSAYRVKAVVALCLCTWIFYACTRQAESTQPEPAVEKLIEYQVKPRELAKAEKPREPQVFYHLDSIKDQAGLDSFQNRYTDAQKKIIFALNRIDAWRLKQGDLLIIPDSLETDLLVYSPFPREMVLFDSIPKVVLISQRIQGFALYEQGKLIKWGPVSSGKLTTPTPNGLHYGNFKAKRKVSTVNPDWLLPYYFNFMNFEGVGVHQYAMPGYPASHACVRLLDEDARFIYDWAEHWKLNENEQVVLQNGTPFMVFGEYDFSAAAGPWLNLAEDPKNNFLTPAEMDTLEKYVRNYFSDPRNFPPKEEGLEQVL